MANHIHLYMSNPTAGLSDGTEISSGTGNMPLSFTLDATQSEVQLAKVAVRCDTGYEIAGGTSIYFEGTTASKWQVAEDDDYSNATSALAMASWQSAITLAGVSSTNTVFWVKAMSLSGEDPHNDMTVSLVAEGLVAATE